MLRASVLKLNTHFIVGMCLVHLPHSGVPLHYFNQRASHTKNIQPAKNVFMS